MQHHVSKLTKLTLCAVALALPVSPNLLADAVVAPAPAKSWTADAGVDYFSEYIFRGFDITHNNPICLPHANFGWNGFGLHYSGYYGDSGVPGNSVYEEQDFSGDYTHNFLGDKLTATAGVYGYQYFDRADGLNTVELYGVLVWNWPILNPKLTINWDIDQFHTAYLTAGVSHPFDLTKLVNLKEPMAFTITPSAALGIGIGHNLPNTSSDVEWNDVLLGVSANLQVTEHISIHTGVQISLALDVLNNNGQGNETIANFGVNVAF